MRDGNARRSHCAAQGAALAFLLALVVSLAGTAAIAGATYTTFKPNGSTDTQVRAINDKGAIAGYYYEGNTASHGFVRAGNGKITSFDPSGARFTYVTGIHDKGVTAGSYLDGTGEYGFVRAADGTITTFATGDPNSIND